MKLKYGKNEWEIKAPNICNLCIDIIESETNKKYLTLRECAKILYSLNQSVVVWNENEYKNFIGSLKQGTSLFYMTETSNSKGKSFSITRENVLFMKNSLEYLLKVFSSIVSSMILDRKFRLYIE
jgi:hypothetical protein